MMFRLLLTSKLKNGQHDISNVNLLLSEPKGWIIATPYLSIKLSVALTDVYKPLHGSKAIN